MMINILLINFLSIMLIMMSHPLSMGLILLTQTINISLIIIYMNLQSWFSYLFFLIMVGGMLILFIYMTSIASNEKFKFSIKILVMNLATTIMFYLLIMKYQIWLMNDFKIIKINLYINQFFVSPNYSMLMMLLIYLFITLIATVKITNINYGPLRQMN
uniref:NADH-ubiquinone oxidoreductase chain 6 n=1 Tax=Staphylinoidea sp. 15 KM-2017 TaxID=2219455 RepID=A0A346RIC1_9COLE|nr:NADH dehydrogenase subunit 6 [Staphylinoidea sp. 15 KM-2017]